MPKQEKFFGARSLYFHEPLVFRVVQFILTENPKRKEIEVNGKLLTFLKDDKGASAVEYGLLVALITAVMVGAVTLLGEI